MRQKKCKAQQEKLYQIKCIATIYTSLNVFHEHIYTQKILKIKFNTNIHIFFLGNVPFLTQANVPFLILANVPCFVQMFQK